jgi:ABC-type uncharacterized transport system permease subunit
MRLFAEAVGADQTLFSTNGSSQNVHIAMMTAAVPGETVIDDLEQLAAAGVMVDGAADESLAGVRVVAA